MLARDARSEEVGLTEFSRELQGLGFSDYEARAYMTLLERHPATAYEVSKLAGLPRANVYAVLQSLQHKHAVQPVSENPARYAPVEPEILFERIAESARERCTRIVGRLAAVRERQADSRQYVWSLAGEAEIDAKISEMIAASASHVWVKAMDRVLERHRDDLARAARRGVEVLIILFGQQPERFRFGRRSRVYLHEGNGIPVGLALDQVTLTTDFDAALVANLRAPAHGAYTRNQPVVTMADTLIRHEIYMAEIFVRFGAQIQKAYGPALFELRRRYLPGGQVEDLRAVLAQAGGGRRGAAPARRRGANAGGGS